MLLEHKKLWQIRGIKFSMSEKPFSQYSQWHFKANAPMNSLEGTNSHGYWNYQTILNFLLKGATKLAIYKYLIFYLFVFYYLTAYIILNNLYNKSKQYGNSVLSSPLFCVKWTICKYAFILMSMSVVGLQQIVSSSAKKCNIPRLRTVVFVM